MISLAELKEPYDACISDGKKSTNIEKKINNRRLFWTDGKRIAENLLGEQKQNKHPKQQKLPRNSKNTAKQTNALRAPPTR